MAGGRRVRKWRESRDAGIGLPGFPDGSEAGRVQWAPLHLMEGERCQRRSVVMQRRTVGPGQNGSMVRRSPPAIGSRTICHVSFVHTAQSPITWAAPVPTVNGNSSNLTALPSLS